MIALKKLRGDKLHVCEGGAVKRRTIAHDVNHKCCYCPAARQGPTKDQEVVILGDALADYADAEGGGMLSASPQGAVNRCRYLSQAPPCSLGCLRQRS